MPPEPPRLFFFLEREREAERESDGERTLA